MDKLITKTKGGYAIEMNNGYAYWQPIEANSDKELVIIILCELLLEQNTDKHRSDSDENN